MFLTRKKLNEIIKDKIDDELYNFKKKFEKEIEEKERLKKWHDFYDSNKVGFIVKYNGIEWEVLNEIICYGRDLILCAGKTHTLLALTRNAPIDIDFVYE